MPRKPKAPAGPKLPRFSPTRLERYRTCPRSYHFYYDRALRWGGQTASLSFGASMHRTLQVFHGSGGAGGMSLEELHGKLESRFSGAGYASPEEAASFREAGKRLLESHYEASAGAEAGRTTLAVEKTIDRTYEDFVLFGKVDRIDRRADGVIEVIDYKSFRRRVTEDDVRGSLAMAIYQLLVARANPGARVLAGILSLRTGESAFVERSSEELDAAEAEICALARAILADAVKAPTPGPPCRPCPYPKICPAGRDWLLRNDPPAGA